MSSEARSIVAYFDATMSSTTPTLIPAAQLKRLKIYFDVGSNDDYGFEQGGEKLHQLLDSRGIPNEFHVYPGRHDPQFVMRHFGDSHAISVESDWQVAV